jgi:hypothetical protein
LHESDPKSKKDIVSNVPILCLENLDFDEEQEQQ